MALLPLCPVTVFGKHVLELIFFFLPWTKCNFEVQEAVPCNKHVGNHGPAKQEKGWVRGSSCSFAAELSIGVWFSQNPCLGPNYILTQWPQNKTNAYLVLILFRSRSGAHHPLDFLAW